MRIVKRSYALAFVSALTALAMGLAVMPVHAKPIERERFRESSSEVFEGFCGDLTVRVDTEVRGTFLLNPHGPDGLAYASERVHGTDSFTNLANNKTFTEVFNYPRQGSKGDRQRGRHSHRPRLGHRLL